jgi:hypothetical protein
VLTIRTPIAFVCLAALLVSAASGVAFAIALPVIVALVATSAAGAFAVSRAFARHAHVSPSLVALIASHRLPRASLRPLSC